MVEQKLLLMNQLIILKRRVGSRSALLVLLLVCLSPLWAQTAPKMLRGVVVDESGLTLPGVSIVKKGTSIGTVSNVDGEFSLQAGAAEEILVFSYIGYSELEVAVSPERYARIEMKEASTELDEVVVVAYGAQKKVSVTGSMSSIKSEDLLRTPVSNVSSALVGKTSGLFAVQRSGEPGKDNSDIYIRGIATFAGGDAVKPLILVDGVEREMNTLDPNEIESVNILKDASATAVFGVRGANGVVIITTKTGTEGKTRVSASANFAVQNPIRLPKLLNAHDWAYWRNEASRNDDPAAAVPFSPADLELYRSGADPVFHPDVNWFDTMLKEYIPQQQYNVNISGGTKAARYYVSLGLLSQEGAFRDGDLFDDFSANSKYKRYNIRANTDFQWTKAFSTSVKFGTQISDSNYAGVDAASIMNQVFISNPIASPVTVDDKLIWNVDGLGAWRNGNPPLFQLLDNGYSTNFSSRMNIDISSALRLDVITQGLQVRGKLAYDNYYNQYVKRRKPIELYDIKHTDVNDPTKYALVISQYGGVMALEREEYTKNRKFYLEGGIDYNRTFDVKHTFTGLLLGTMERYFNGKDELPFNYMGLVGRLTYNYSNRYMGEVNMGYNGSENFAKGKQFGFFPAFSLGYNVSEEAFFPENDWLSFLKIRGSLGWVGNDKIQGKRFLFTPDTYIESDKIYYFGQSNTMVKGYKESMLGNPDVTWEKALKTNLGMDLRLWKGKITMAFDIFKEERDNILWNLNVPVTFGSASLIAPYNIGQAENKGIEIELGINDEIKSWGARYWFNTNFSFARNKILYMDEVPQPYANLARTGQRINQPFGLICEGFYNTWEEINDPGRPVSIWEGVGLQPGDLKYQDVNGDGKIDENDFAPIGYPNVPEIIYGFSGGFSWNGFDFSVLFQGADHVSTYISGHGSVPFRNGNGTAFVDTEESWTEERYAQGLPISLPRLTAAPAGEKHNYRTSSFWQKNARYLRLKNMELGYDFATRKAVRDTGISSLRLFMSGQNLLTWSPMRWYDPEIIDSSNGGVYPMTRLMSVGVSIQF